MARKFKSTPYGPGHDPTHNRHLVIKQYVDSLISALTGTYYTQAQLDGGQLDNRYYTETEVDAALAAAASDNATLYWMGV